MSFEAQKAANYRMVLFTSFAKQDLWSPHQNTGATSGALLLAASAASDISPWEKVKFSF